MLKRRIWLLLSMVGVFMLLAGCSSVKEPITADSPHFWDKYVVFPLSELITYVAKLTGDNYGLSIIIVTILIRLLILPLMIKQLRSSKAMQALQPEMQKLKEKYSSKDQKRSKNFSRKQWLYFKSMASTHWQGVSRF